MNYKVRGNTKQQSFCCLSGKRVFSFVRGKNKKDKRKENCANAPLWHKFYESQRLDVWRDALQKIPLTPPPKEKERKRWWHESPRSVAKSVNVTQRLSSRQQASSAFQSTGLTTISSRNINACCKYYWQPWLSDGADVSGALLHKWGGCFQFFFFKMTPLFQHFTRLTQ